MTGRLAIVTAGIWAAASPADELFEAKVRSTDPDSFDCGRLTRRPAGRDFRLTDVHGRVVQEVLA